MRDGATRGDAHPDATADATSDPLASPWRFTTERLRARELCEDDLDFVATMLGDPQVMRFYPAVLTRVGAAEWIGRQQSRYDRDGHGLWLIELRATGEPVGQCGVAMQTVNDAREPEVGYLLHHPFWKRGLATEAARAARDWSFARYPRHRVVSLIRAENQPSRAVAERNGMVESGITLHAGLEHLVYAVEPARPG